MAKPNYKNVQIAFDKGYRVTDSGNVVSPSGIIRKTATCRQGYHRFSVSIDGKSTKISAHRLAALQKFGDDFFMPGIEVRHLDGDNGNNSPANITIGTHSQNMFDVPRSAREEHARIAASANRAFTNDQIVNIREMLSNGLSLKHIASQFGVAKSTISYIKNRITYKDV